MTGGDGSNGGNAVDPTGDDADPTDDDADPTGDADGVGSVPVVVIDDDGKRHELPVERGRTLRDVLLEADHSPYTAATERLNCGGRGLCATCGVRLREGPAPDHWHDRLAERFGYPRLSCQVVVDRPMTVELPDKRVWGGRERER